MGYQNKQIEEVASILTKRAEEAEDKASVLRAVELKALYAQLPQLDSDKRASFGKELNELKKHLEELVSKSKVKEVTLEPIDVTSPMDINVPKKFRPKILSSEQGSIHPITSELSRIIDIYARMGFETVESRQIDDDYNMFESLNFPTDHPARDDYDTFMTTEGLIAPAHTSTMQNRVLTERKLNLKNGEPIAVVVPGRVFRNEDLDATHEHTLYQLEGVYVDKGINVGNLLAVLQAFMSEYFGEDLDFKIQPSYFPFTEPSFEFAIEKPQSIRKGDTKVDPWLELLGCGMIHPNVLKMAGIDPNIYTGFAWGGGVDRLVMLKYGIDDIRYLESAKLEFLKQFGVSQ